MERPAQTATLPVLPLVERPQWAIFDLVAEHRSIPDPWAILQDGERARALRFHFEHDRTRWVRARAYLRQQLGTLLNCDGQSLQFRFGSHDKPFLADSGLEFNLSHSGDLALLAWSWQSPVGVDLEFIKPEFAWEDVARTAFSDDECHALFSLPHAAQRLHFYKIWTAKEAYVKGLGCGIGTGTKGFSVWPRLELSDDWCIEELPLRDTYCAALAWRNRGAI